MHKSFINQIELISHQINYEWSQHKGNTENIDYKLFICNLIRILATNPD